MNTRKMAEAIYHEVYGDVDDKRFHAARVQEIQGWLDNGNLSGTETSAQLAQEWREYSA